MEYMDLFAGGCIWWLCISYLSPRSFTFLYVSVSPKSNFLCLIESSESGGVLVK